MSGYAVMDDEFLRMVRYFYEEKGDPTRYMEWDAERFETLCPVEYDAWRRLVRAQALCDRLMQDIEYNASEGE